jgi:hypothetical protein
MFKSRFRKEFGDVVGRFLEDISRAVAGDHDARRWLDSVCKWLRDISPEDRLNCLRLIWFERKEASLNGRLAQRIANYEAGKLDLVMKHSVIGFPPVGKSEGQRQDKAANLLQQRLETEQARILEEQADLAAETEFYKENRERLLGQYGKPSVFEPQPHVEARQTEPNPLRALHYSKQFGQECGREIAILEESLSTRSGSQEFIGKLLEWLSNVDEEDRLIALKVAGFQFDFIPLADYLRQAQDRIAILASHARQARKHGKLELAYNLEQELRVAREINAGLDRSREELVDFEAALLVITEKYGPPPLPSSESDDNPESPWLNWNTRS